MFRTADITAGRFYHSRGLVGATFAIWSGNKHMVFEHASPVRASLPSLGGN